jgi:hypothetical protein
VRVSHHLVAHKDCNSGTISPRAYARLTLVQLTSIFNALHADTKPCFIVKLTGDAAEVHAIDEADALLTSSDSTSVSPP